MSDSPRLSVPDLSDPASAGLFYGVAQAATDADGYDPFNEQTRLDLQSGRRAPGLVTVADTVGTETAVGALVTGEGQLDLVIDPAARGNGYGGFAAAKALDSDSGEVSAWSHGDHPAARSLASRFGFALVRKLLRLRLLNLHDVVRSVSASDDRLAGITIGTFDRGKDEDEWVSLNSRIFAAHPEQGRLAVDDILAREAEEWFSAADFLVARDGTGRMVGYNWLKIEKESRDGEIYVVGVDLAQAGRGLGRRLMNRGLQRLADRGCNEAVLYVEGDNLSALHLYRSVGFVDDTVDVQYRRGDPIP